MSTTTAALPIITNLRDAGELADATPLLADPVRLRDRLAEDGYLLLRGLLPCDRVMTVRRLIVAMIQEEGWLTADQPGPAARPDMPLEGDERHRPLYRRLLHHPTFAGLARSPELLAVAADALAKPVLVHTRIIGRLAPPHQSPTQPHQDFQYIRGSLQTLTAWIPLGDCPRRLGGLAVLPASHRLGFREHVRSTGAGGMAVPTADLELPWLSTDYHAGDVLLFPSCTIHAALPNRTVDEVRLSADFRYQPQGDAIDPDSLRQHYGLD